MTEVSTAAEAKPFNSKDEKDTTVASESLRILRVATDTYPEVVGGGAIHAHEMSAIQSDLGHDVTLLTSDHGDRSLPRREEREGYTLRRFRELGQPLGNSITPGLFRSLRNLRDEFDVVHAHSHLYLSTNMAAVFAQFDNTPLVVTNHGLYSQSAPSWFNKAYLKTLGRFTLNAADKVLCYTETDEKRLREFGVSTPVSLVHNGVDCEQFAPTEEQADPLKVLYVGRLVETKGVPKLIDAFDQLDVDACLQIVGEGPQRTELEQQVRELGVEEQVTFAGRIPNDKLPAVYAQSSVFALPSSREGLPRTLLEALACGTPVITSDLPQLESLVNGVGMTVPEEDVGRLTEALEQVLSDAELREQISEVARQKVVQEYSWRETVRKTTYTYHKLIQ
jgi:glycosyltransferase involved in cell wall biosynthesis